jgi:L-threonylcarbamoyladenylate synthase
MDVRIGVDINEAAAALTRGKLVAIPTETVYGLAADARNADAVRKVFEVKGRPEHHPVIVHLAEARWAKHWAERIPEIFWTLAAEFWPGPLTMVVPRHPSVSNLITGSQRTIALRIPAHPLSLELLGKLGRSVVAPSANRFGHISPTSAQHVADDLGDGVSYVLDGGPCKVGLESTILDLTCSPARILRPGRLSREILERFLPLETDPNAPTETRAPGMLAQHYAPSCPTFVADAKRLSQPLGDGLALLAYDASSVGFEPAHRNDLPSDPEGYGHGLYAALRALEDSKPRAIVIQQVPAGPEWVAVSDRLQRAARPWPDNW